MIRLIKSPFYNEEETKKKLADFIFHTSTFSMGEYCRMFEEDFSRRQKCRFSVFVSSGSMANLVLIQSMLNLGRLKLGDKIGFSALTWPTNIMPIIQLGLIPVPVDCELDTLNVSPGNLELHISDIKCLFLTNVLGFCDRLDKIASLCEEKGVILLEDNCESLGSAAYGKLLGNFGTASTFSFFIGHHLSTIEGGMICTDDEELRDMLVMVRAHGWDRNLGQRKQQKIREEHNVDEFFSRYTFYDLAYNARPTEINGFIGTVQLEYLDEIIRQRASNFQHFHAVVKKNESFIPLSVDHMDTISNFAMPVICKDSGTFVKYRQRFENMGVEIRPIIAGDMTKQPFYNKYMSDEIECQNASTVHKSGFYFGNNPELTNEEISAVTSLLE